MYNLTHSLQNLTHSFHLAEKLPLTRYEINASGDVRVTLKNISSVFSTGGRSVGSKITEFNLRSQRRAKYALNSLVNQKIVMTLTYPIEMLNQLDGVLIKKHLNHFKVNFVRKYGSTVFAWVREFHKNLNPHYHLTVDTTVEDIRAFRKEVRLMWYKVVGSGLEKHLRQGVNQCDYIRDKSKTSSYLVSYLQKADQKKVPENFKNCGRFWGISRHAAKNTVVDIEYKTVEAALASLRIVYRYRRRKLKRLAKKNGVKYHIKKKSGGCLLWSSGDDVYRLIMLEEQKIKDRDKVPF